MKQPKLWYLLCFLWCCAVEKDATPPARDAEPPRLFVQRVTATVTREATRLLRVETEREAFITTPEHPFATPQRGWVRAGQLAPGDRVVSARYGTVRVASVRSEKRARPVAVFNLTVDRSHAYLVGTGQVLVHNKKCKDGQDTRTKENNGPPDSVPPRESAPEAQPNELTRRTRELEETERAIALLLTAPKTIENEKQLQMLKRRRRNIMKRISDYHAAERRRQGIGPRNWNELRLKEDEAEYESNQKKLEEARKELGDTGGVPSSGSGQLPDAARKAELTKRVAKLETDQERLGEILAWERQLAELQKRKPASAHEHVELDGLKRELNANIQLERKRKSDRLSNRAKVADPEQRAKLYKSNAEKRRRWLRTPDYLADPTRLPDALDLLNAELAKTLAAPPSVSRDRRAADLARRIQMLNKLVELRRGIHRGSVVLAQALQKRTKLASRGDDTSTIDQTIAERKLDMVKWRAERNALRAHVLLVGLADARSRKPPLGADDARIHELEGMVADPTTIDEARLAEIEREVAEALRGDPDTLDAEFFEEIWREAEPESAVPEAAVAREIVRDEASDVDAELLALGESLETSPSPARDAAAASGLRELQNELREERSAYEAADFLFANEYTFAQQTLPGPGSSRHAEGLQRLKQLQQQRADLRTQWRDGMTRRLERARQDLQRLQEIARLWDETAAATLAQQIALLEYELQHPFT